MHPCSKLLFVALLWVGVTSAANEPPPPTRFSQTLAAAERAEFGFDRLSSDQVAVLDALVRRDIAGRLGRSEKAPEKFSQRLTADERRNAGLEIFKPAEIERLDALVDRYTVAGLARTLLAPMPVYVSRARPVDPRDDKPGLKVHGSLSVSMGWGSGGYSERTGSMMVRLEDPAGRYALTVGYGESHIKNGSYYRDDSPALRPVFENP